MTGRLVTEIISIRSLQELLTRLEKEINSYLSQQEEYRERLGKFLREAEEEHGDEEWFKQLDLDKLRKSQDSSRRTDRRRREKKDSGWISFQNIKLSTNLQGEAELMFDALTKISEKLEKLNDSKNAIGELRKVGLGNDVTYICYLENGVVKKIMLKPLNERDQRRFMYNIEFSIQQPI